MTKFISILSGKGGVGKTTTTINLGVALTKFNRSVLVVDANLDTPNVALQLGFPPKPLNLHAVLRGTAKVKDAISVHDSGLNVLQAGLSMADAADRRLSEFRDALAPLQNETEMVLLDCGAGLWGNVKKAVQGSDEALIVTNPELPALVDALKAIRLAEQYKVPVRGIVVNKVTGHKHDLKDETITGILKGYPIIGKISYDEAVQMSVLVRQPVVSYKPNSKASRGFRELAATIAGIDYNENFFSRFVGYYENGTNGNAQA